MARKKKNKKFMMTGTVIATLSFLVISIGLLVAVALSQTSLDNRSEARGFSRSFTNIGRILNNDCNNVCEAGDSCPLGVECVYEGKCPSDCPNGYPPKGTAKCGNGICEAGEADVNECSNCNGDERCLGFCKFIEGTCNSDCDQTKPFEPARTTTPSRLTVPVQQGSTAPSSVKCVVGGCSAELCLESGSNIASPCVWKEEYACYRNATCERQSNGSCGWTSSNELTSCLNNSRGGI